MASSRSHRPYRQAPLTEKVPCELCGRTFLPLGLKSHAINCAKRQEKKKRDEEFMEAMDKVLHKGMLLILIDPEIDI
jgi:hypothetical protein